MIERSVMARAYASRQRAKSRPSRAKHQDFVPRSTTRAVLASFVFLTRTAAGDIPVLSKGEFMQHSKRTAYGLVMCLKILVLGVGCDGLWRELASRDLGQEPAADSGSLDPTAPRIPRALDRCPELQTGDVQLLGTPVRLWLGEQHKPGGPLVIYWYGTGSSPAEVTSEVGPKLEALLSQGAVVATLVATTGNGTDTGTGTWYTGDLKVVDQLVACAVEQLGIDARRIYTTGCSYGAVQAGVLAYLRSSYVAAAALNSGGSVKEFELQDAAHVPAVITAHGPQGQDLIIVDFHDASLALDRDVAARGGFAVDCAHELNHCGAPPELKDAQWQFLQDHPFGVSPEPYANGLPDGFPEACEIIGE
jgi:predicted esterase